MKNPWKFVYIITIPLILLFATILSLKAYDIYNHKRDQDNNNRDIIPSVEEIKKEKTVTPEEPKKVYTETPAFANATYFEKIIKIKDQYNYIAYPLEINPEMPPVLIVYSHGSNTTVTTNQSDSFIKDLKAYGKFFAEKGYGFIASNQHGMNYGSTQSIQDTKDSIDYMKSTYKITDKTYQMGFSMGGLPTLYYTMKYPTTVSKVALLAPVTYIWSKDKYLALKGIDISVWHGDKDVNVPLSASYEFKNNAKKYGIDITLNVLKNKVHWDVDTELKNEILQFYEQ